MKYLLNKFTLLAVIVVFISNCSLNNTATKYDNICGLMNDKISWYKGVANASKKYKVDKSLILAFIKQESRFKGDARPPREELLGVIPWNRPSSSYGFSQAKDGTWEWYQEKTGRFEADRGDFADSSDFIGWYVSQTYKLNKVSKNDVYKQYLAYHEGHGGYNKKSYLAKPWLLKIAKKVENSAKSYKRTLKICSKNLDSAYSWSYF